MNICLLFNLIFQDLGTSCMTVQSVKYKLIYFLSRGISKVDLDKKLKCNVMQLCITAGSVLLMRIRL